MPTTYSPSLRIALLGDGEDPGTWGQLTNTNLGTLLEQAITGVITVDVSGGSVTLTSYNGVSDQSRNAVLVVTGTQSTTNNIVVPNATKSYFVNNTSSYAVGVKTSSGSAFNCPTNTLSIVYCDGVGNVVGGSIVLNAPTYSTFVNPLITGIRETVTVSATAATGVINFDYLTQAVLYYSSSAAGNWVLNFRGNSTTTLSAVLSVGQAVSVTFICAQGGSAYYNSSVQIDGVTVTPYWQNNTPPTYGNASGLDVYTYAIIKTSATPTYTVLASQTQF
jgi:hypothetical protein